MPAHYDNRDSFLAPARHAFTITPSATELTNFTRAVMVTEEEATITGILEGDTVSHTTPPLKVGILYPFAFKVISAVSDGSVVGYR